MAPPAAADVAPLLAGLGRVEVSDWCTEDAAVLQWVHAEPSVRGVCADRVVSTGPLLLHNNVAPILFFSKVITPMVQHK